MLPDVSRPAVSSIATSQSAASEHFLSVVVFVFVFVSCGFVFYNKIENPTNTAHHQNPRNFTAPHDANHQIAAACLLLLLVSASCAVRGLRSFSMSFSWSDGRGIRVGHASSTKNS